MIKKGALFKLIKSLTKAEKRYFKLTMLHSDKNYLALFDYIEKQNSYDEEKIKIHFAGKIFVKQLHVTKNYLSKLIIKSLKNFHQKSSKDLEIKNLLEDIEILFKKELYSQVEFEIEKCIKLAEETEKLPSLLDALNWRRKLLIARTGATENKKEIAKINLRQNEILKSIYNLNEYYELTANFFDYFQTSGTLNPTIYSSLSKNPLITNPDSALTFEAKILYCNLLYAYQIYKDKNYTSAYQSLEQLTRMLERNADFLRENPSSYINAINDQIDILLHTKKYLEIPQLLEQIRQAPGKFNFEEHKKGVLKPIFQTYLFELELYRDTGQYDKGLKLIPAINDLLKKYPASFLNNYEIQFFFQIANFYFQKNDLNGTQNWLKKIIKIPTTEQNLETHILAKILNLMTLKEQDNLTLSAKLAAQTKSFIKKFHRPKPYQKLVLEYFQKLSGKDPSELAGELHSQLKNFEQEPEFQNFNEKLLFIKWLENSGVKSK